MSHGLLQGNEETCPATTMLKACGTRIVEAGREDQLGEAIGEGQGPGYAGVYRVENDRDGELYVVFHVDLGGKSNKNHDALREELARRVAHTAFVSRSISRFLPGFA